MGHGGYDRCAAVERQKVYKTKSLEEIYTRNYMCPDMDPRNIAFRESRDSEEHPNSYDVTLIIDETGSMYTIPEILVKEILPDIIQSIIDAGIPDVQVNVMFIGDCDTMREQAPLQIGQYESSDGMIEHWLTNGFLEGRGGSNGFESYSLAWYWIDRHVKTDAWDQRSMKGVVISIGDDSCQPLLRKESLDHYINDGAEDDVRATDILKSLLERKHVFHIHCENSRGAKPFVRTNWRKLLGPNAVLSTDSEGRDIKDLIPKLVLSAYNTECGIEEAPEEDTSEL